MSKAKILLILVLLAISIYAQDNDSIFTYVGEFSGSGGWRGINFTFKDPVGLALSQDSIYVSDSLLKGVYEISEDDDTIINAIGDHITYSDLSRPLGIMYSPITDSVYIADSQKGGILVQSGLSDPVRVGPSYSAGKQVVTVWTEGSKLWILNKERSVVEEYDLSNNRNSDEYFQKGASSAKLSGPMDMFIDENHVYIADTQNNRIQLFDRDFEFIRNIGLGKGGITLNNPRGVTSDGKRIYISDTVNQRIIAFSMDGYPLKIIGGKSGFGNYSFNLPTVLRYKDDHLYVIDSKNKRVVKYSIDWSRYIPDIYNELSSFNTTLNEHKTKILHVLDLLKVEYSDPGFDSKMQKASKHAKNGDYVQAQNELEDAKELYESSVLENTKLLRLELKTKMDEYQSLFDYYKALDILPEQSVRLDNYIETLSSAKKRYDDELYSNCAGHVLEIDKDFSSFQKDVEDYLLSKDIKIDTPTTSPRKAELIKQAAELEIELSDLSTRATKAGLFSNTEPIHALISSAKSMVELGEYGQADAALLSAKNQMDRLDSQIKATIAEIADANKSIADAWSVLNSSPSANDKSLIKKLVHAETILEDDPKKAKELAIDVLSSSKAEGIADGHLTTAIGGLVLISVSVLILAMLTIVIVKVRKKPSNRSVNNRPRKHSRIKTRKVRVSKRRGR